MFRWIQKLKNSSQAGFMLADGVVGVVVLALGLVAVAGMFIMGTRARAEAEMREKALQLAVQRLEYVKGLNNKYSTEDELKTQVEYLNTRQNTDGSRDYHTDVNVESALYHVRSYLDDEIETNVCLVSVVVDWTSGATAPAANAEHDLKILTYVRLSANP